MNGKEVSNMKCGWDKEYASQTAADLILKLEGVRAGTRTLSSNDIDDIEQLLEEFRQRPSGEVVFYGRHNRR